MKPIFLATHPRACSTAFERVFMSRKDLTSVHEPFGEAFYYGPERLSARFGDDDPQRLESGFSDITYRSVIEKLSHEDAQGRRLFIKDIAHYLCPPHGASAVIAPSLVDEGSTSDCFQLNGALASDENGSAQPCTEKIIQNPTVLPREYLSNFQFTFLIRHPRHSIPSYYRCTIPPLSDLTKFYQFQSDEAGYQELRHLFDYLRAIKLIGPEIAPVKTPGRSQRPEIDSSAKFSHFRAPNICVIDADDLLENPEKVIEGYCSVVGLGFDRDMLKWGSPEDQRQAENQFAKWKGFHEDVIQSTELKPRPQRPAKTKEDEDFEWTQKFGNEAARLIRKTVDDNIGHYEYLKQFAFKWERDIAIAGH